MRLPRPTARPRRRLPDHVDANGAWTTRVDGREVGPRDALTAGWHPFELDVRDVPGTLRLRLDWTPEPGGKTEIIPPAAFSPS